MVGAGSGSGGGGGGDGSGGRRDGGGVCGLRVGLHVGTCFCLA